MSLTYARCDIALTRCDAMRSISRRARFIEDETIASLAKRITPEGYITFRKERITQKNPRPKAWIFLLVTRTRIELMFPP